jgi:hypothetical protein
MQISKPQIRAAPSSYAMRMRASYLPKFAVAVLVLAAVAIILSGQVSQVVAKANPGGEGQRPGVSSSSSQGVASTTTGTCGSHHHHCNYYSGYYGYNYYSYNFPYYDYYYGAYSSGYYNFGYPYFYSYNYPYYYSYYNTPSQYTLTVTTDPASIATVTGGGTYNQGSSASFSVTQTTIQSSQNTRYVFSHWGGDYSGVESSGTVTVNGAMNVIAVYQLQYYLSVQSQPQSAPVPQGAGWYNAGETATVNSASQPVGDSSSRIVFQGWSVDGQSNQTGSSLSVNMNTPHSVTAEYKQQYYLTVLSDQGVPTGQGWYDAGSTAQIFVSTPISTSYGVSIVFNGWQGDVQSNSQTTSVQMDRAKMAIASWRTDSTVLYLTIAAGIIAILAAAAIIAFAVGGRAGNPPNPKATNPEHASETHASHPNHTKKKTEETKQADSN